VGVVNHKETFLRIWDREAQTTVRVLQAFPADRLETRPHERSRSIRDLGWQCCTDERVIASILDGQNDLRNVAPATAPPETMEEIIAEYRRAHRQAHEKMSRISEEEFGKMVTVVLRGGQWEFPQPEAFWGNLMDEVHHRGQLTVYLRQAGGKVPSIYGASGDEPMQV
jgi:uncharacterized damage-inducible protein DinB